MDKLNINQWAEEDRPREKMMQKGAEALSDAELLAILIGSGNTEESAVALMQRVLAEAGNNLHRLGKWQVRDFARFKGLGPAKSISIMAALELGKRRTLQERPERPVIRSSKDIYELFHPLLCDLATEEFWVLLLNQGARVIDRVRISRGGLDQTTADVRTILREALLARATQLVLVHNHPSGNTQPSPDDTRLTQAVRDAARLMNIHVLDHIIVTDGAYYSFNDEGRL
ncbi:MAG TPA: DNA repair protein RadC [Candidatus Bacteroides merdigallinarum]|uniref:DNA repair protein RadC n=1 Tax=Candidatus Bacteroides merdigallinarum TaxID=2838473 RepID=A0A9D2E8D2_9BACE|nr:DNA repair protein RadC [Candidatus Bacteroides merdigallinarum]